MKSGQRKRGDTRIVALRPVPGPAHPKSPGRSFEEVLRQCSSQVQRQISLLRVFPWLNRARALAPKHLTAQPFASAWAWFKTSYASSATKRLRVAETISLGEKRFVAILHVDGCEFLIGGGTSGISLLAQVEMPLQSSSAATDASVMREVSR